jgi:hypothetical protein
MAPIFKTVLFFSNFLLKTVIARCNHKAVNNYRGIFNLEFLKCQFSLQEKLKNTLK